MKKWVTKKIDKNLAKKLAEECDVDPFVAMIASSRGYDDPALLEEFLSDEPIFSHPFELLDMEKAANTINESLANGEKIAVYGDYDCDGVTATALVYSYLLKKGANVIYHIPDRFNEGYGMNKTAIDKLHCDGVNLIITVDNGISCKEEVEHAKALGIKVVITDHHLPPDEIPDAVAVVDPHRKDDASSFKDICGVAVAFKLVCAIEDALPEEMIYLYGDLVALGTLGDVMPLTNENRSFVKCGFEIIKRAERVGISALLKISSLDNEKLSVSRISFGVVPRINAAGRMGSAKRAVELLVSDDYEVAVNLAEEINAENSSRQEIEKEIFSEAVNIIEAQKLYINRVIVVAGENWHHGIVGIVASRICERYGKPTIVLSIDGDIAHGSGRSLEGFSLYDAINFASDFTEKFGGHEQAAGVSVKKENIEAFRNKINEYALKTEPVVPVLNLDCKLNPAALNIDLVYALEILRPFGAGNPAPVFGIYSVQIEKIATVGNGKHLKISFIKGAAAFQAMLFSCDEKAFPFKKGEFIDIAVGLETNIYNGKEYLSIQIKDYRYAGINDENLAEQLCGYDYFINSVSGNYEKYCPTIDECRTVYKHIHREPVITEGLIQRYANSIGIAKIKMIIDILCEMSLVGKRSENGTEYLFTTGFSGKVDLNESITLKRLRG